MALNTNSVLKLKYTNMSFVPRQTVQQAKEIRRTYKITSDIFYYLYKFDLFTANPNHSRFGQAKILASLLKHAIELECRNPNSPTVIEIEKILLKYQILNQNYHFEKSSSSWRLEYKCNFKKVTSKDWVKHSWIVCFYLGENLKSFEVDSSELQGFSRLLALLNGQHTYREIQDKFADQSELLSRFLIFAKQKALLKVFSRKIPPKVKAIGLSFHSHSSLSFNDGCNSILIDPCLVFLKSGRPSKADLNENDQRGDRLLDHSAIFITHNHWDHCNLSTLVRMNRETPFYVPKVRSESGHNPSIKNFLTSLGFENVFEVENWKTIKIGKISLTPIPFYGEWFGPKSRFDAFCFVVEIDKMKYLGLVDSDRNDDGDMNDVLGIVKKRFSEIDFMLFCSSALRHQNPVECGTPWRFGNDFNRKYRKLMRYHPDVNRVFEWCKIIRPRVIIPYAEFIFQNQKIRRDICVDESFNYQMFFNEYWRDHNAVFDVNLKTWRDSLKVLIKRTSKMRTDLLMLGPGESFKT